MIGEGQEIEFRLQLENVDWETGKKLRSDLMKGLQIGRYALVAVDNTTTTRGNGGHVYHGGWLIAHWQSGATIARAQSFTDACVMADYISAFGPEVEGEDADTVHAAVVSALSQELRTYLTWPMGLSVLPSFLTWRANLAGGEAGAGSAGMEEA